MRRGPVRIGICDNWARKLIDEGLWGWCEAEEGLRIVPGSIRRLHRRHAEQDEAAIDREAIVEAYHRKIDAHERATGEKYPRIATALVTPNGNIYSDSSWKPRLIATWQKLLSGKYQIELL